MYRKTNKDAGFSTVFLLLLAVVVIAIICTAGWLVHQHNKLASLTAASIKATPTVPTAKPTVPQKTITQISTSPTTDPSISDIAAAHAAMLAWCQKQSPGDICSLMPNSDQTAPGFVKTGFGASYNGYAAESGSVIMKVINGVWTEVWDGQSCMDSVTAAKYAQFNIPTSFQIVCGN